MPKKNDKNGEDKLLRIAERVEKAKDRDVPTIMLELQGRILSFFSVRTCFHS